MRFIWEDGPVIWTERYYFHAMLFPKWFWHTCKFQIRFYHRIRHKVIFQASWR